MPKSKNKKQRYVRKGPAVQPAGQVNVSSTPVGTSAAATVVKPVTPAGRAAAAKAAPVFQIANVGSELKVIGIISAIILVTIIVIFFVVH